MSHGSRWMVAWMGIRLCVGCFPILPGCWRPMKSRCWRSAPVAPMVGRLARGAGLASEPHHSCESCAPWCSIRCHHEKTVWQSDGGSLTLRLAGSAAQRLARGSLANSTSVAFNERWSAGEVFAGTNADGRQPGRGDCPRDADGRARVSSISRPASKLRRRDGNSMNMKRMRGRGHRPGGGGSGGGTIRHHGGSGGGGIPLNRNHVFDSNGPDLQIRGTSQQLFEKYLQLGRDATSSGDRVMADLPARGALFPHPECHEPGSTAAGAAQRPQQAGQRRSYGEDGNQPMGEGEEGEPSAPGMGDQPEAREIPIAAAPPEA